MVQSLLHDVVEVRHLGGQRLWLRFDDGVEGEVELRKVIREFHGVLSALREPSFVSKVRVHPEFGTITWPGEIDLDPVVLYCAVRGIRMPTVKRKAAARRVTAKKRRRARA